MSIPWDDDWYKTSEQSEPESNDMNDETYYF